MLKQSSRLQCSVCSMWQVLRLGVSVWRFAIMQSAPARFINHIDVCRRTLHTTWHGSVWPSHPSVSLQHLPHLLMRHLLWCKAPGRSLVDLLAVAALNFSCVILWLWVVWHCLISFVTMTVIFKSGTTPHWQVWLTQYFKGKNVFA